MFASDNLLLAGVVTLGDLIFAISFVAVFAVGLAVIFAGVAHAKSPHQKNTVYSMLAALPGSIIGVTIADHLFWKSHNSTPALVWYFSGLLFGGLASMFAGHSIQSILRRFRDRGGN